MCTLGILLFAAAVAAAGLLAAFPSAHAESVPYVFEGDMLAVADTDNHRIQVFHADGTPAFAFGSEGSGNGNLSSPQGVAVGPDGTIAVADTGNDRVQVFYANGTFAGKFGTQGGGPGQFDGPRAIAFLPSGGMLAVADTGNDRVQILYADGTPAFAFGSEGSGEGHLSSPSGIAVSRDHLGSNE